MAALWLVVRGGQPPLAAQLKEVPQRDPAACGSGSRRLSVSPALCESPPVALGRR